MASLSCNIYCTTNDYKEQFVLKGDLYNSWVQKINVLVHFAPVLAHATFSFLFSFVVVLVLFYLWGGRGSAHKWTWGFPLYKKDDSASKQCKLPFSLRPGHFKTEALQNITQFFIIKWENLICYIVTLLVREMLQWWRKSMLDQPKSSFLQHSFTKK